MSLKKNVIANYFGQGWTSLMSLAFTPVYIKYIGMEAYGLIGVFVMLQTWLTLLDMGLTPTINREMARFTAGAHSAQSIRDLLRTIEYINVAIAIFLGISIWLSAPWLSTHWLHGEKLDPKVLTQAISIMGLVIALRFIESLYRGVILGLQRQVWISLTGSGLATLRSIGAVLILIWYSPSIEAFFLWQGLVSLLTVMIFVVATYQNLPDCKRNAKFSLPQFKSIWRFAIGMMFIALQSLLLMQIDKIILSRMLSLEMFGYYTLAWTVAATLYQLMAPVTQAYYPRFTELIIKRDYTELIRIYHQSAQLGSVLIISATLMLVFFGNQMLLLWTGNALLSQNTAPLLALLAIGTMFNGFMSIPYLMTVAYGQIKFTVYQNIVVVALIAPSVIWATLNYGAMGAAWVWLILNLGFVLISVHFMNRWLLVAQNWRWYRDAIFLPLIIGTLTVLILRQWLVFPQNRFLIALALVTIGLMLTVQLLWVMPTSRLFATNVIKRSSVLCSEFCIRQLWVKKI